MKLWKKELEASLFVTFDNWMILEPHLHNHNIKILEESETWFSEAFDQRVLVVVIKYRDLVKVNWILQELGISNLE